MKPTVGYWPPPPRPLISSTGLAVPARSYPQGFLWSAKDEPHATRRKLIMKAHPEVTQLCGEGMWTRIGEEADGGGSGVRGV